MADSAINQFVASGTAAEMAAFTPTPPSPASGPDNGYTFYNTDDGILYAWDGANWQPTGGGSGSVGISAGTQSVNTGTVVFSNSNGVSFGMSGSSQVTASVRTNYAGTVSAITGGSLTVNPTGISLNLPAYLTTAALSQDSSKYAGTNGAITGGSITVNTSGVSVNLPAYLTTAMASNRGTDFVQATAGFHGTNASGTIASSGISVSIGNYLTTAMASNRGSDFVQATAGFFGTNASGTIASDGISVSVDAGGGGSVNFSAGTTSNTYSAVTFADAHGVSFGLDNGTITASVGATAAGNVNFSAGTTSSGLDSVVFSNSNGVSFGLNGSTVTATVKTDYQTSGNYLTTAMQSNAVTISNINVSGGTTSSNLSALKFIDSQGVSWSLDTGSKIYATVKTDYQTSGNYLTTAMASNRGSDFVQATAAFHGTNISGTINSNDISLSVAAPGAASINFSAGTTSGNQTAIRFADSNGVSFGLNAGTITATVKTDYQTSGAYLTTAALSGDTSKYVQAWELTGNTAGTTSSLQGTKIYYSGGNGLTVSGNSNTIALSVATYNTTSFNTVGSATTVFPVGSANSTGTVIRWAHEDHVHAGVAGIGISTSGNSSGTSGSQVGTYWLQGGNNVTISQITSNNGSHTAVFSVANFRAATDAIGLNTAKTNVTWTVNSSGISLDAGGYAGTGFTTATTTGTVIVGTHNTAGLSMGVPAFLTAAGASPVNFSAGTTSNNLGTVVFSNSNGVSFGLNGSTITGTVSTYSTVGTATSGYDVASANSIGTITRWAAEDHRHAGIGAIGISTGNTTGTSGSVQGTYWIVGGTNQTISQITSNNGSHTLVIAGKNEGYMPFLEPYPLQTATQTFAPGAGTWYLAPFTAFGSISGGRINVLVQNTGTANLFLDIGETAYNSGSTGGIQQSYTLSAAVALFSQGVGANSSLLQSLWSNSYSMGWSKSLSVSTNAATNIAVSQAMSVSYISDIGSDGAYTLNQYANSGSSTIANSSGASTAVSTVFSSGRNLVSGSVVQPFGFNTTISAGVYWLGYAWSSTRARASTGNLTTGSDFSFGGLLGLSRLAVDSLYRNFGSTASTARSQLIPYGLYTAAANMVPPVDIKLSSDLSSLASQWVPYFNFQVRGLTK